MTDAPSSGPTGSGPTGSGPTGSGQAWADLADQFAGIARQFRSHHERLKAQPRPDTEPPGGPVEQAMRKVGQAIEDAARTIDESVRDPAVRRDGGQAGSALIRAVGATLTDLGAALQRQADPPPPPPPGPSDQKTAE